jgi:ABC-type multidrug transport system fused ATPase/permease subunit
MKAVAEGRVAGKLAFDIIDRKPNIDQDKNVGKGTVDNLKGAIEFKNVDFFYPSRPDHQVLTNFSFKFQVGKITAIVGPSGSGKSTIVQLIERFYDPNNGEVLIDGMDIKDICLREFRQQVGYVGQEPVLFNTTIKKNILFGCPGVTDTQIVDALKKSNAWEFINNKPEGINLQVGAAGGQISGGQKQRIAIARAFIKNPKILIFDEATSALDKKNEIEVQASIEAIRKELGAVTTIVIAHRLSTIRNAD